MIISCVLVWPGNMKKPNKMMQLQLQLQDLRIEHMYHENQDIGECQPGLLHDTVRRQEHSDSNQNDTSSQDQSFIPPCIAFVGFIPSQ